MMNQSNKKLFIRYMMVISLALFINTFFFFAFPVINYLKSGSLRQVQDPKVNIKLTEVNLNEKREKIKKIKVKQERPKKRTQNKTKYSRFEMKFGAGEGTGAGMESKKITGLIYKEGEVDTPPKRKKYNIPRIDNIPASMKGNLIKALIHIDENGRVSYVEIIEGVDGYNINEILKNALLRWEFYPALVNNIPVKVEMIQPIRLFE